METRQTRQGQQATNSMVSREEEPPHMSHHGAREISHHERDR